MAKEVAVPTAPTAPAVGACDGEGQTAAPYPKLEPSYTPVGHVPWASHRHARRFGVEARPIIVFFSGVREKNMYIREPRFAALLEEKC